MSLNLLDPFFHRGLNPRHHLLLGDQVIDSLQQAQEALHAPAPLVQHLVGVARLGETDHFGGPVDLGVDGFGGDELADVGFRFVFVQVEQLRQAAHLDARVVLGDDPDVVLDDALAEILPARMGFGVRGGDRGCGEDVRVAKVAAEVFGNDRPPHEFGNGKELQKLCFRRGERIPGIGVNTVEKIGLFVVIWRENNVIDNPLKDLKKWLEPFGDPNI